VTCSPLKPVTIATCFIPAYVDFWKKSTAVARARRELLVRDFRYRIAIDPHSAGECHFVKGTLGFVREAVVFASANAV
jgi:hypothetical protein